MLEVQSDIQPVKAARKERNAGIKNEIRETLQNTAPGQSFVIEGEVKRATVKLIAATMNIKIKIAMGTDEKLRCWRI